MSDVIKILFAEHDHADLELIQRELKAGGIHFISAVVQNEKDYIKSLEEFLPEIILSDFIFPAFHGLVAFRIRQERAPDTPFIFVSGTIGEEKSIELIKTGVTDYALKDNLGNLPLKINRALKEAQAKKEKEKTAEALQDALDSINKMMDSSPDVICAVDEAGIFIQVSAASEVIWGYKPSELIGKNVFDYVYKGDRKESEKTAAAVMQGTSLSNFENRYIHKHGYIVPMVWSARWNEKDRLRYAVGRDATEKKRAEYNLEAERQRFFNLFLQAPLSMGVLKGPDHIFEMVNPLYLQLIGREDILGKSVKELIPEVIHQGFIEILDDVYRTGKTFFANEKQVLLDKHGNGNLSVCYLNIVYQAYKDDRGRVEGIFFFTVDVTEQILSRIKIEESEKQYRQIVETAQEGIWLLDENNDTILVNKKMAEIMEYEPAEMIGKNHLTFIDGDWKQRALEQISDRKRGLSENYDFKFITRSGNDVWTNISTNPVFDDDGAYEGTLAMVTDITDKKSAEVALIKRDSQLRLATEMAKLGYWEFDVVNDLFSFTNQFYAIFRTSAEKVGGYTMSSARYAELFVHPDDVNIVAQSITEAIASSTPSFSYKAEHRIIYEDGEIGYISVHFYIVKDSEGRTIRNYGVNQDITERKISEEKIRESNQRFKYVAKATSDAIWDWNLVTKSTYWGEGFQHLFGYRIQQLTNDSRSWTDYIHPDDRQRVMDRIQEFISGTETNWEDQYRYLKEDRNYAQVIDKGFILRDNNHVATRMIGAKQDITKQKKEEQHLKLLESVITHLNDAIVITDVDTSGNGGAKIIFVNESFTRMTGYEEAEAIGRSPVFFLQGRHTDMQEMKRLEDAISKWEHCEITVINYKKNGEEFWNHFSATPLAESGGLFTHWIYVQRDVTENKKSEIILQEMNRNLEKHTKELAISNAELEQFAYVTSHDLQEPLRMVTSFLTQLENKYTALLDERGKTYIAFAVDGARRMRHIILDLLEFSRIGRTEEKREYLDLNETAEEMKVLFSKEISEKNATLVFEKLPVMNSFKAPVRQIFQNLIGNALKYARVDVPAEISISVSTLPGYWQFAFADNGIGIASEYFDKIFVIFQRLHRKEDFPGTGMGLAVTKKIIENQGGKIWLTSEEGKGSTFYFTLQNADTYLL